MSIREYKASLELELAARQQNANAFHGLIMAAMRTADDINLALLRKCWPQVWEELVARHAAPGGLLPEERTPRTR
jgi:hypothetical protein